MVGGNENKSYAPYSLVIGWNNTNGVEGDTQGKGQKSGIFGQHNNNTADYVIIGGYQNTNSGQSSIVTGQYNSNIYNHSIMFGWHNNSNSSCAITGGLWNRVGKVDEHILILGNGSSEENRSNAFEVYRNGSIIAGGFRGDKPGVTPDPIPNNDATTDTIEDIDTISVVKGIQSAAFGAGNRAYGNWNFIAGKDNKTFQRGSFAFGGKNLVGDYTTPDDYSYSFSGGSNNIVKSKCSIAYGDKNSITTRCGAAFGESNVLKNNTHQFAAGFNNIIQGQCGSALGAYLISQGMNAGQLVIGKYNKINQDALFIVGNGEDFQSRTNVFEVLDDGRAKVYGVPTEDDDVIRLKDLSNYFPVIKPIEKNVYYFPALSVNNDNSISYWSIKGTPEPSGEKVVIRSKQGRAQIQDPVEDMDIVNKRYVDDKIGNLNIENGEANGSIKTKDYIDPEDGSTDVGGTVNGIGAIAFGKNNTITDTAKRGAAIGNSNYVAGNSSFAQGQENEVYESCGVAMGRKNINHSTFGFMAGFNNIIQHSEDDPTNRCVVIGADNMVYHGEHNYLIGVGLKSDHNLYTALGKFNDYNNEDALLVVGNGTSDVHRSNAFEILRDGRAKVYGKPVEQYDLVRLSDVTTRLINGTGADSIIQTYSGEVDDTHFGNTAPGESAAAFGEANTVGANRALSAGKLNIIQVTAANSITAGLQNNVIGAHGLTVGGYNDNRGIEAIMAGAHNYSVSVAGITAGHNNGNYSAYSLVVGTNNLTQNNDGIIVGGNWSKDTQGLLLALGNGTSDDNRSNAFEVSRNGSAVVGGLRYDYAKYKVYQNLSIILNETLYEGEYYINSETGSKYCTIGGVNLIDEALNSFITGEVYVGGALREITVIYNEDGSLNTLSLTNPDSGGVLVYATIENNPYIGRTASSAEGNQAFAAGGSVHAYGDWSIALGKDSKAYQRASVALGGSTKAGLTYEEWLTANNLTDTEANKSTYEKEYSFAFAGGESSIATGRGAFAFGGATTASGKQSVAFGYDTTASGLQSLAVGSSTQAAGARSIAVGDHTIAGGIASFAGGQSSVAYGQGSFSYGYNTRASGLWSSAIGQDLQARQTNQFVIGRFNDNKDNTLFEVGFGSSITDTKNVFEVLNDSRVKVYGAPIEENDAVRLQELNTKFDKTGGTINGDVTIGGNLTVQGTTSAIDVENLRVEDNVIVVNSTGSIPGLSGIAMAAGPTYEGQLTTPAYGIMWSPFTESSNGGAVKLGIGNIDNQTGEFTYMEGEDQCLATIDWSIQGGHLTQWDENLYTLVDAGVSVADLATKEELTNKVTELEAKITELESELESKVAELEAKLTALLPRTVEV